MWWPWKRKKVFCSECVHYECVSNSVLDDVMHQCNVAFNIGVQVRDTPIERSKIVKSRYDWQEALIKNRRNNCKDFKPKKD